MSTWMVILLVLFILCNGIWMAAIIAASRADRIRMRPQHSVDSKKNVAQERDDVPVKSQRLVRKAG